MYLDKAGLCFSKPFQLLGLWQAACYKLVFHLEEVSNLCYITLRDLTL